MTIDPIVALESLGYTEREASFLYLVAIHSGYFLRRQFNTFIERQKGFLAQRFVEKGRIAGHIEIIDYGQGRFVYHLFSKPIYRLLGIADSQNRRRKGDGQIRARLMALDYVFENPDEHYLESEQLKRDFFTRTRGVDPGTVLDGAGRLHPFLGNFPVSVVDRAHQATSLVRFPFMDEGLLSMGRFTRFLTELTPLLRALGAVEIVYIATSERNFPEADRIFKRIFSPVIAQQQRLLGDFRPASAQPFPKNYPALHASFTTLLFHHSYPNLLRNECKESVVESAHGSALEGATT